jgi:hypothetical protein
MIGMSACVLLLLFYFMSRWFFYVLVGGGHVSSEGARVLTCPPGSA